MSYGQFSDNGREFIITSPDTPRPWFNCITNGSYSAIVSQTGGGYSFIGGPGYDRITRADPDLAASGRPGRYVYARDNSSGEFFSIGWEPVKREPDWFECRHTQGETTVASRSLGITGRITYFVPLDDNLEIWRVSIENNRDTDIDISVFTYVEWVLGSAADDLERRQMSDLFNEAGFQDNYVYATKHLWRRPDSASVTLRETRAAGGARFLPETMSSSQGWGKWAYVALSIPVDGFDCDRAAFLGRYGDLSRPQAVVEGRCTNSEGNGLDAVGALQSRLLIPAGLSLGFDVFLGVTMHKDDPSGVVARYAEPGIVEEKLAAVRSYWDAYLSKLTISTPDAQIDRAANIWDQYQNWVSARTYGLAGPSHDGSSIISFRGTCFDLLGVLPLDYEAAKLRTVGILQHQHRDGSSVHYWEARSDVGVRTGHLDDAVWLVFAITSYLKETGDLNLLGDRTKYYYAQNSATLYDHMIKALEFCLNETGPRGLSALGPGDWNEFLDEAGREEPGESVLTSMMLCWALAEAAELAALRDDSTRARYWTGRAREIAARVNELAWDDSWYIRAVSDERERIGSASSHAGKIFLTPQVWSIIAGIAEPARADAAMNSVYEKLDTPFGPAMLHPAYDKPGRHIGALTRFSPGKRENGGISTIAVCWAIIAECRLGHGRKAYELMKKTLHASHHPDPPTGHPAASPGDPEPATHGALTGHPEPPTRHPERSRRMSGPQPPDQDRTASEPYARAAFIDGPASADFGHGSFTWQPGVAAWTWRTAIDWICGVRPDYSGLIIDPCVPPDWQEFTVTRPFREAVYVISVKNPKGVEKGVSKLSVDGRHARPDRPVPPREAGQVHRIDVEMG